MSEENGCHECENCTDNSVQEQLRLDQDVYVGLVELYVLQEMLPESNQVFNDYRKTGSTIEKALSHAVVNDMANKALVVVVEDLNYADALIAKGEAIQARYKFYNKNNKEDDSNDNSTEEVPR